MAQLPIPYAVGADIGNDVAWQRTHDNFTDLYAIQSRTVNAGDVRFAGGATTEARIQLAIDQAVVELAAIVFVPAFMLPYDASLVTFSGLVRMVREGGDFSVYDVRAYGADHTGVIDAGPSWNACRGAVPAAGGPMVVPFGSYALTTAFTFAAQSNVSVLIDPGVTLTGEILPVPATGTNNTFVDYRSGLKFTGVAPFHIVREHVDVPANQLNADTNYVMVGKSKDAVICLISEKEGVHGSGIQLAEVLANGTYQDMWFIGKRASDSPFGEGSGIVFEYGTNPDYGTLGTKWFELTPFGRLVIGSVTPQTYYVDAPGIVLRSFFTGTPHLDTFALRGMVIMDAEGRIQVIGHGDGNNNSMLMLSDGISSPNRHWMLHHRGTGASNKFAIQTNTSTADGDHAATATTWFDMTTGGLATFYGKLATTASATGGAGFNVPHGAAPTSPVDGDIWTTTAGLFVRVNGSTVGPLT